MGLITRYFIVAADSWTDGPWPDLKSAIKERKKLIKSYKAPDWWYFVIQESYEDKREGRRIPGWMMDRNDALHEYAKYTDRRNSRHRP